jgi:hypothetical protein
MKKYVGIPLIFIALSFLPKSVFSKSLELFGQNLESANKSEIREAIINLGGKELPSSFPLSDEFDAAKIYDETSRIYIFYTKSGKIADVYLYFSKKGYDELVKIYNDIYGEENQIQQDIELPNEVMKHFQEWNLKDKCRLVVLEFVEKLVVDDIRVQVMYKIIKSSEEREDYLKELKEKIY